MNRDTQTYSNPDSGNYRRDERIRLGIDCKKCGNTGFIMIPGECGYPAVRRCACETEYANRKRIERSGMLKSFEIYNFVTYKAKYSWQKSVMASAIEFTKGEHKWFYIGGAVGSGKTHICTAICGELIKSKAVHYMPWRDDIVAIKANVTNDEEYQRLVGRLKTTAVLYIDDFFKGKVTEADINVAFEVISSRYINRLTTVISSELDIDDIMKIDMATGSRIYQMSTGYQWSLTGNDKNMRLKGGAI